MHPRMKKIFYIIALFGLVGAALLTGCKKEETPAPPTMPATNAMPEAPPTNAPAPNAPAQ